MEQLCEYSQLVLNTPSEETFLTLLAEEPEKFAIRNCKETVVVV